MTPRKKPSVIVMKRSNPPATPRAIELAETRRAGVRLSAFGGLTPHRRGEPTSDAPPLLEFAVPVGDLRAAPPTAALHDLALAQTGRPAYGDSEPAALPVASPAPSNAVSPGPLPALVIEPALRRSAVTAWAAGLLTAGVLVGVTLARILAGPPEASPRDHSVAARAHVVTPASTAPAPTPIVISPSPASPRALPIPTTDAHADDAPPAFIAPGPKP